MTAISDERLTEIEAALGEDTFAGITRTFEIKVPELRAIIQSLRAQGGVRAKPYVKRNAPGHEGDGGKVVVPFETDAEMRRILSSIEASPAPVSGEMMEENKRLREAIEYYEIGVCAVGVPHEEERKVLHDCVREARALAAKGGQ